MLYFFYFYYGLEGSRITQRGLNKTLLIDYKIMSPEVDYISDNAFIVHERTNDAVRPYKKHS